MDTASVPELLLRVNQLRTALAGLVEALSDEAFFPDSPKHHAYQAAREVLGGQEPIQES